MQALGCMITGARNILRERPRQTLQGLADMHLQNTGKQKVPFITNSTSQNKK